jgi:hypothetical protein
LCAIPAEQVERVVLNALTEQLRLGAKILIVFGEADPPTHSACFASISILIATVWLMPETDSAAGANIKFT